MKYHSVTKSGFIEHFLDQKAQLIRMTDLDAEISPIEV